MGIFISFIKKSFLSFWGLVSILLTVTGLLSNYFDVFENIPYQTEILICFITVSMGYNCYKLYRDIGLAYPDVLIKYDNKLKDEKNFGLFREKRIKPKFLKRKSIYIEEDKNSLVIEQYSNKSIVIGHYNKICINNKINKDIELQKPKIKLISVNDIESEFLIRRMKILLQKVDFSSERYNSFINNSFGGVFTSNKTNKCEFPIKIKTNEVRDIYLHIDIFMESMNDLEFDELLDWIRDIKLKIDLEVNEENKKIKYEYIIEYNYRNNQIKDKIEVRNKEIEKICSVFNK